MARLCFALALLLVLSACRSTPLPADRAQVLADGIEALVASYPGATVAVAVRDLCDGFTLDRASARLFHAASTMKIPVLIEVYRQAAKGRLALTDSLLVQNAFRSIVDGSSYRIEDDSDDALYERLGTSMTIGALAERMITVSSNLATNLLIDLVSADSVQRTAERLGVERMRVLRGVEDLQAFRRGLNNQTTAADLALLLSTLYRGAAVSTEADRAMLDLLATESFRDMIPAGLPVGTRVAHKTGVITAVHHDAALVYPPDGAPYVLVVLTEGIEREEDSAALGAAISRLIYRTLR